VSFILSSGFLPGFPLAPSNRSYLLRDNKGGASGRPFPALTLKVTSLLDELKLAYRAFTSAQFDECKASLDKILRCILLISVSGRCHMSYANMSLS
jgi:hypothetical protein